MDSKATVVSKSLDWSTEALSMKHSSPLNLAFIGRMKLALKPPSLDLNRVVSSRKLSQLGSPSQPRENFKFIYVEKDVDNPLLTQ